MNFVDDEFLVFRNLVLKQICQILVWSLVQTIKNKATSNKQIREMINNNKRRNIKKHEAKSCQKGQGNQCHTCARPTEADKHHHPWICQCSAHCFCSLSIDGVD